MRKNKVETKLKKLQEYLNRPNEGLIKREDRIKKLIRYLGDHKCDILVKIKVYPKKCMLCLKEINESNFYDSLECCQKNYAHKNCVISECLKISPFLKEFEVNKRIPCKYCNQLLPFQYLKKFLVEKINEIHNKLKPCNYCQKLIFENELTKKNCNHTYCKICLNTWLGQLVDMKEFNCESLKCKVKDCDMLLFNVNDFKTQFLGKYSKAEDFYLKICHLDKNESIKRCVGEPNCPRYIKNSPKPEYLCMNCEENLKKR